jgi:hypothetical protein
MQTKKDIVEKAVLSSPKARHGPTRFFGCGFLVEGPKRNRIAVGRSGFLLGDLLFL